MNEELLTRLDDAKKLGMGVCGEAAFRIRQLEGEVAMLQRSADKVRADALSIAFERQRQAAVRAQSNLDHALASQDWSEDAEDPEEALRDALKAVTAIAGEAGPEEVGAKLLDAASDASRLQREVNSLRLAQVASGGLDPDALRREGIRCERIVDQPETEILHSRTGVSFAHHMGDNVYLTLHGVGPGARSLETIGRALMRP